MTNINHGVTDSDEFIVWLGWADKRYKHARRLLLDGDLVHGLLESHFCIELYIKALLKLNETSFPKDSKNGHNIIFLNGLLLKTGWKYSIREEYLKLLRHAYFMRYPESLKDGYKIFISQPKMLVELDNTVFQLVGEMSLIKSDKKLTRALDTFLMSNEPSIVHLNSAFFPNVKRETVFLVLDKSYSNLKNVVLIEVEQNRKLKDDNNFEIKGLELITPTQVKLVEE